jgi:hypothetical protein
MEGTVDRGAGFVITKRTDFDVAMHKPVAIRYILTREGLPEPRSYGRLGEAREAAQKPLEELLPPPPPEPEPPPETAAESEDAPAAEAAPEGEDEASQESGEAAAQEGATSEPKPE